MLRKTRLKPTARLRAALLLVCCACLLSVVALGQQPGKSAPAQTGQRPQKSKQIFLSGKNESPRGSSVTIRSDTPLNDYSAYRSGDRFYVVIPKASANSMPRGASGRGFADMQVQQRGNDVVLSYKLQPGAKPRVNQRFDRLDVVFDTPEGSSAQNAQQNTPAQPQQSTNTPQANPRQTTTTPAAATTPTTTNPERTNTQQQQPATQTPTAVAPGAGALPGATQSPLDTTAPTVTDSPLPETSPTPADAASQQVAQTQPPATTAPITTTNPSASRPSSGSFAAAVLNNWPAIIGVLLLAGMVLFIMAQRSASRRGAAAQAGTKTTTDNVAATTTAAALKETPALKTTTVEKTTTAPVAPVITTEKKDKKDKKKADTTSPSLAAPISAPVAEKTTGASQAQASDAVKEADEVTLVSARQEPSPVTASVEPPATAATTTTTVVSLPTSEVPAEPKKSLLDEQVTSEITPVVAVDAERVQVEIKRLLDGQAYDKGTLSSADMMTRQMIAAELLAALAGRNPERKQRARTAFVEQGFFNETAHDLHFAGAPAERASAARSLGLLGDRVATSHLIAALADQTMEVRRACVEALSEVRDPKAVAPLKSLLEREKELKVKVPRKLIQRAIEACERGDEVLMPTATAIAVAPAATEPAAIETAATETAATEPVAAEVAAPELLAPVESSSQLTPTVDEETPTLVADETPTLVTSEPFVEEQATRSVELEPVATVEPSSALDDETPTVLTPAPLDIERAEVAPESVHVEEDVIDLNLEPEVATTAVAAEADREAEDAALPPLAAEPSMPFFAGETLAVPTEELNASAEELTVSPAATTAPEFETHRAETLDTSAVVAPVEGFETTQARDSEVRSEFDWIELDDLHAPPPSAPSAPTNAAAKQDEPQEIDLTEEVSRGGFEPQPIAAEASSAREAFNPPQASPTLTWDEPTLDTNAEAASPVVETPAAPVETRGAAALEEDFSTVPKGIQQRLASEEPAERVAGVKELARLGGGDDAFHVICAAFDDSSQDVRSAAARTLFEMQDDRAESFTRALREAPPERRRNIGGAIASSGLATEAIGQLTGASRDKTYEAFSLLFLMAKAGEVQPLVRAIEAHPDNEVRLAVVKLLALSGQRDILPAFRRLAVRGSLPTEVRSAVMEAIYQISSSTSNTPQEA